MEPSGRESESMSYSSQCLSDLTASYDWIETYRPNAGLEHNDALSAIEFSSVSASRISLEAEHRRIRTDIASLLDATALLQRRATLLRSITDKHVGGVSSLRRFPAEVLLEVFEQYVGLNPEPYHVFRTDRGPWKLRQVCRKWHQLASTCPHLWSRFAFYNQDVYRRIGAFPHHRLDLLRTAIMLSASRPLNIKIVMDKDYRYCTSDTTNEVLGILQGVSEKWESLHVEWNPGPYGARAMNEWLHGLEHGKLPLLKRLSVRIDTYEMMADFPYRPEQITAFASAPRLTSVSIVLHQSWEADNNSAPGDNNFDFISLPYRQLVDLHCADVYEVWWNWPETRFIRRAFVDMLDTVDAPNLRTFSYMMNAKNVVSGTAMPERPPPTSGRAVHCGVVKLGVCHPDILERYAFPALADLSVGDLDSVAGAQYPVETMSLVHSMLVASGSPLTVLRLFGVVLDEYFLSTIRLVAYLEVLEIGIFSWSKLPGQDTVLQSFFRALSVAKSSAFELLPALRSLRIKISLDSDDIRTLKPHSDSRVPIRHFGFANATLAHALKVRCCHRSLDFALVVMADKEYTWELDLNDLCESSGLCAAVQRKGVENRWEPVYSEGERFLDKLDDDDRCKLPSHEQCCHDVHPPKAPKPCADCARRKEDDEFWKAGVI